MYRSPVEDILFSLRHVAGLDEAIAQGLFGDLDWDTVASVIGEAGRFATEVIAPLNRTGDLEGAKCENGVVTTPKGFRQAYKQWVEGGWAGVTAPAEQGGMGLPHSVNFACSEIWNGASMGFALCPLLSEGALGALNAYASPELKETYVKRLASGEWTGTMNLTEPQAGSDLNAVRARAERAGDGTYRVFGQKIFITYGEHDFADNIVHLVLARLPDAPPGTRGISLFLVPKFLVKPDGSLGARNDVRCASIEHKLGIHASPTCVMIYGDNGGATGFLVGEENRGLAAMFVMMNSARLSVGLQGVAIAERAYQHAAAYARERRQGRAGARAGHEPDRRAPRRAAHADDDEGAVAGGARNLPPDRRRHRPLAPRGDAKKRARRPPSAPRCSRPSPRPGRPTSATRRPRSACRCMAAWAISRRPARRSTCATPASPRSTRARTASRRSTSSRARFRSPAARRSRARSPSSARSRPTRTARPGFGATGRRLDEAADALERATGYLLRRARQRSERRARRRLRLSEAVRPRARRRVSRQGGRSRRERTPAASRSRVSSRKSCLPVAPGLADSVVSGAEALAGAEAALKEVA